MWIKRVESKCGADLTLSDLRNRLLMRPKKRVPSPERHTVKTYISGIAECQVEACAFSIRFLFPLR